jgi:type II secretory pathway pseudopilin PulG
MAEIVALVRDSKDNWFTAFLIMEVLVAVIVVGMLAAWDFGGSI